MKSVDTLISPIHTTQSMETKQRYRLAGVNGGQPVWLTKSELAEINKNYNEVWNQINQENIRDDF